MQVVIGGFVGLVAGFILAGVLISTGAERRDENRVRDGWMAHGNKIYTVTPAKPVPATP